MINPCFVQRLFQLIVWHSCQMVNFLEPQGAVTPGFNALRRGKVYSLVPEAPFLGECRRGPRHFWSRQTRVVYGLAPRPTSKMALSDTCPFGEVVNKYRLINPCSVQRLFQLTVWHSCQMINFLEPQGSVPPGFNPLRRG